MRGLVVAVGLSFASIGSSSWAQDLGPSWSEAANEQPRDVETAAATIRVGETVLPYVIFPTGEAVVEGDIIIGNGLALLQVGELADVQSTAGLGLQGLFRIGNHLWPKGIVPYVIDGALPQPERVRVAIRMWEDATDIEFREVPPTDSVYVKFVQSSFCRSAVGFSGRRQTIELADTCTSGNVAHEIGHALGHTHEQMRSDRDQFVAVQMQNIQAGAEGNFIPKPAVYANVGAYCFDSIFHYGEDAFARAPGLKTIVPKTNASIGQRKRLAPCDIETTQAKYAAEFRKR
jgi:hypothetical protein